METGARCARHQGVAAVGVCTRCGNFMCAECNANGARSICAACDEKTRFVPLGVNASLAEHVGAAWNAFKSQAGVIIGALAIWFVLLSASGLIANVISGALNRGLGIVPVDAELHIDLEKMVISFGVASATDWFMGSLFDALTFVGLCQVLLEALQGRKASLAMMFDFSRVRRALPLVLSLFAIRLPVDGSMFVMLAFATRGQHFKAGDTQAMLDAFSHGGWALIIGACVAQLVYFVLLPFQVFAIPQFAMHGTPVGDTLRAAWRVASGQRLRMVGWWFASLVALFVGALACCVGLVVVGPLVLLVWCSLFLSLRAAATQ